MSGGEIWLVTGVRTEARHLANLAAYRANMDTGAWVARAIRRCLESQAPAADSEDAAPALGAKDNAVVSALKAEDDAVVSALKQVNERLDRSRARTARESRPTPDRAASPAPAPQAAPERNAEADADIGAGEEARARDTAEAGLPGAPRSDAPTRATLPVCYDPPATPRKLRVRPWVAVLAATAVLVALPFVYLATSGLGVLRHDDRDTASEFIQNMRAVFRSVSNDPALRRTSLSTGDTTVRTERMTAPPKPPALPGPGPIASLKRAAATGDPSSQFALGMRYATGQGLPIDTRRAMLWLHRAAAQGSADAQFNLAVLSTSPTGASHDRKKAFVLYKRAADRGHPGALHNLGIAYALGHGTSIELREAARLIEASARRGVPLAAFNLGLFNEFGLVGAPDRNAAMKWYRLGAENGEPHSAERLRRLASATAATAEGPAAGRSEDVRTLLRPLPLDPVPNVSAVAQRSEN